MKTINEQNNVTSQTEPSSSPSLENNSNVYRYDRNQMAWKVLNFTFVSAVTSGMVITVQSPIKTILLNITKHGTFIPNYSGGSLGLVSTLYRGTTASLVSSGIRTSYVSGTKNNKHTEIIEETKEIVEAHEGKALGKAGYVASSAFGDVLVSQVSESLSYLRKIPGFLPENFKWYTPNNTYQLMTGAFVPRYVSGLVNFAALCLVEEEFAKRLPISNKNTRHFVAGGLSGMTAAIFSYPPSVFKDYILTRATISNDGQLSNKSTVDALKELGVSFIQNPKEGSMTFLNNAVKQLPLRMGLCGAIFSTVSGVITILGSEPLRKVLPERVIPVGSNSQSFFANRTPDQSTLSSPENKQDEKSSPNLK